MLAIKFFATQAEMFRGNFDFQEFERLAIFYVSLNFIKGFK